MDFFIYKSIKKESYEVNFFNNIHQHLTLLCILSILAWKFHYSVPPKNLNLSRKLWHEYAPIRVAASAILLSPAHYPYT